LSPQKGVMQTRDEETKKFFKHSSVICVLSPRYPSSKLGLVKQKASEIVLRAINVEIF
jgi:phospholipase D1/2